MSRRLLPPPPHIRIEVVEDSSPPDPGGFLRLLRRRCRAHYPDGTVSEPFLYDEVDRPALDAVVVAAHFVDPAGTRRVFLRSVVRPPVALRDRARSPLTESVELGSAWELPAGLVEASEQSLAGVRQAAAREVEEELGFALDPEALAPLGPSTFPAPGVVGERHFFFHVPVVPASRRQPENDGSPLEHAGAVIDVPLTELLEACRRGEVEDAKTELAARRLLEILP